MTDSRYDLPPSPARRRRPLVTALVIAAVAFVAGLAAMGWVLARWPRARAEIVGSEAVTLSPVRPASAIAPIMTPPPVLAPTAPAIVTATAPLEARIDTMETRLDELGRRSEAAISNASRAEGLLVAVATRRTLDRGAPLGYLEGLLRDRFGTRHPQAVGVLIGAGRNPVTVDSLRNGLEEIAPRLGADPVHDDWWSAFRRELAGLVVVKRIDRPGNEPADRIARARALTETAQIDRALAEVNRLPGRMEAAAWLAAARRYVSARNALDTIETAALLDADEAPGTNAPSSPSD